MTYEIMQDWNPWWTSGEVPGELVGRPREQVEKVLAMLERPEVVNLVGVRRAGKSTMIYQLIARLLGSGADASNLLFINFEDPALAGVPLGDILSEYRQRVGPRGTVYALLDEVQVSKGWERYVLKEYERKRPVRFVVTGSSTHLIRGELSRLLTGRTRTVRVRPLSFAEFLVFRDVDLGGLGGTELRDQALHHLDEYLEVGGFPEVVLGPESARRGLLRDYFDDILYRDVVFPHGVDAADLEQLAVFVLSNTASPLTLRSISEATSPSVNTVKAYLVLLAEANLVEPLEPLVFSTKPKVRERTPSKYYCVDTGLRNTVSRRHSPDTGQLAENVVHSELLRRGSTVHYWKGKSEVDFVEGLRPGELTPMNVSYGTDIPEREYRGLEEFNSSVRGPKGEPMVITRTQEGALGGVRHEPLWSWLLSDRLQ